VDLGGCPRLTNAHDACAQQTIVGEPQASDSKRLEALTERQSGWPFDAACAVTNRTQSCAAPADRVTPIDWGGLISCPGRKFGQEFVRVGFNRFDLPRFEEFSPNLVIESNSKRFPRPLFSASSDAR